MELNRLKQKRKYLCRYQQAGFKILRWFNFNEVLILI